MAALKITGEVGSPLTLQFREMAELSGQIDDIGALIPGRQGAGIPLQVLLVAAGPLATATHLTLESTDGGFSASAPLQDLAGGIIAYRLGDDPLPEKLGGPFRFFVPEAVSCHTGAVDACANVKYLGAIRLTAGPGPDTRPTNAEEHQELHRHES